MGVLFKVMVGIVLHNEQALTLYQIMLKNEIGNRGQVWQRIRRSGEDHIIFVYAVFHVFEYVHLHDFDTPKSEIGSRFFDEIGTFRKYLYRRDIRTSARCKLITDASGTAKQVEYLYIVKIVTVVDDIFALEDHGVTELIQPACSLP